MKIKMFVCIVATLLSLQVSSQQNDTVWKARLTYFLKKEKVDFNNNRYEDIPPGEQSDIYNYSEFTQSGSLKNAIGLLYDSISKGKIDYNSPYVTDNEWVQKEWFRERKKYEVNRLSNYTSFFYPEYKSNNSYRFDTVIVNKSLVNAIMMNREWLYDVQKHKIEVKITDAGLFCPIDSAYPIKISFDLQTEHTRDRYFLPNTTGDPIGYGVIKFCDRSSAALGMKQPIYNPGIVWGREMSMPIISGSHGRSKLFAYNPHNSINDSTPCFNCPMPIAEKNSFCGYITQLKTMFDKTLVDWVWEEARDSSLEVYTNDTNDKMGKKIKHAEVMEAGTTIDTVVDENGNEFVVKKDVGPDQLCGLKIIEEIYFDKKKFRFESKITYAGLLIYTINRNTGNVDENALPVILYWVKFKD